MPKGTLHQLYDSNLILFMVLGILAFRGIFVLDVNFTVLIVSGNCFDF